MPKLSEYLARATAPATTPAGDTPGRGGDSSATPQQSLSAQPRTSTLPQGASSAAPGSNYATQTLATLHVTAAQPKPARSAGVAAATGAAPCPASAPAPGPSPALLQQLLDRYAEQYRRRLRERGGRCYRHPDGSLRPSPPPADCYSQANRKHWTELVQYARTAGGDPEYQLHGFSLRYGIGVPPEAHQRLCTALDLQEELQPPPAIGDLQGDPLADPEHPFNREWKQLADSVFAAAPHPWRHVGLPHGAASAAD